MVVYIVTDFWGKHSKILHCGMKGYWPCDIMSDTNHYFPIELFERIVNILFVRLLLLVYMYWKDSAPSLYTTKWNIAVRILSVRTCFNEEQGIFLTLLYVQFFFLFCFCFNEKFFFNLTRWKRNVSLQSSLN